MPAEAVPLTPGIRLHALTLHDVEFRRTGAKVPAADTEIPTLFQLGTTRLQAEALGVEFSLEVNLPDTFFARVVYRAVFVREGPPVSAEEEEAMWRAVAGRVAPMAIYPYIRETLSGLTARAGLPAVVLPILNIGGMFPPESIRIAAPEAAPDRASDDAS